MFTVLLHALILGMGSTVVARPGADSAWQRRTATGWETRHNWQEDRSWPAAV